MYMREICLHKINRLFFIVVVVLLSIEKPTTQILLVNANENVRRSVSRRTFP